jgi:SAM-dependent methyltransferase
LSAGIAEWGGGYTTDIAYVPGYYPNQSPLHLEMACLLGGVAGVEVAAGKPLSYLELGCGHGFGALALAASNPAWRVTGIDFNPAHIAAARELATESGIDNAYFIEADLATLASDPLSDEIPPADVATMHGLWSWVADPVRAGIVALLDSKVRPGGVVQLSYNALPGWQGAIGMQRLLREAGQRLASRSDRQAAAGIEIIRALVDANVPYLRDNSFVRSLLDHADRAQSAYLAHEYMNEFWRPCFHTDVAAAMAGAKLQWVASSQLIENFSLLMLSDEVREIANRFDDPLMWELIKDTCVSRSLRQDVFVRGARPLSPAERDARLSDMVLALLCSPEDFTFEIEVPIGEANLDRDFFSQIVEALGNGPRSVRDLLALPQLKRRGSPGEIVGMLVGTRQAMRILAPATEPNASVRRFNEAAARRFVKADNLSNSVALATSGIGAPLACPMLDLFVAAQIQTGAAADPAGWADAFGTAHPEEERRRLCEFIERLLVQRVPVWRQFGALPTAIGASQGAEA